MDPVFVTVPVLVPVIVCVTVTEGVCDAVLEAVPVSDAVSVWESVGVPLPVAKGVDPVERLPVMEDVRLIVPVLVLVLVPDTVRVDEVVPAPVAVLLKEMDGVTVPVMDIVAVPVTADVPVPVAVCWLVREGL